MAPIAQSLQNIMKEVQGKEQGNMLCCLILWVTAPSSSLSSSNLMVATLFFLVVVELFPVFASGHFEIVMVLTDEDPSFLNVGNLIFSTAVG